MAQESCHHARGVSLSVSSFTLLAEGYGLGEEQKGKAGGAWRSGQPHLFWLRTTARCKRFLGGITHLLQPYDRNTWKVLSFQSLTICSKNTQLPNSESPSQSLPPNLPISLCSWRYSYVIGTILRSQNSTPGSKCCFGQRTLLKCHTISSQCDFCHVVLPLSSQGLPQWTAAVTSIQTDCPHPGLSSHSVSLQAIPVLPDCSLPDQHTPAMGALHTSVPLSGKLFHTARGLLLHHFQMSYS